MPYRNDMIHTLSTNFFLLDENGADENMGGEYQVEPMRQVNVQPGTSSGVVRKIVEPRRQVNLEQGQGTSSGVVRKMVEPRRQVNLEQGQGTSSGVVRKMVEPRRQVNDDEHATSSGVVQKVAQETLSDFPDIEEVVPMEVEIRKSTPSIMKEHDYQRKPPKPSMMERYDYPVVKAKGIGKNSTSVSANVSFASSSSGENRQVLGNITNVARGENFAVEKRLEKPSSRSNEMEDFQNNGFMKNFFSDWRAETSEITKNCQKIVSREQDILDKCVTAQIKQNQEIMSLLKNVVQNQSRQQNL